jgi:hypothetical protein
MLLAHAWSAPALLVAFDQVGLKAERELLTGIYARLRFTLRSCFFVSLRNLARWRAEKAALRERMDFLKEDLLIRDARHPRWTLA